MKNVVIGLLGFMVAGLGIYIVSLKTGEPLEIVATTNLAKPASLEIGLPDPAHSETTPEESGDAAKQLEKAHDLIAALLEENQALEDGIEPSLLNGIQQIVESPEMKTMVRAGLTGKMNRAHAALFQSLGLTPSQEEAMKELLVGHSMEGIQTGFLWMLGNHEESSAHTIAAREQLHGEIENLLGSEKLAEYEYWDDSRNERRSVAKLNTALGDDQLDDTTSDELVDMMYDIRGEFPELDYLSKPENFSPREITPDHREDIMEQVKNLHTRFEEEAVQILNPDQLAQYEVSLRQQRKELNGFMKFTHGMFNRDGPGPDTSE